MQTRGGHVPTCPLPGDATARWYRVKTAQAMIMESSLKDSPMTLVSSLNREIPVGT